VAFIYDAAEIRKIMRSLNISEFQKPPPLPRAPPDTESYYDSDRQFVRLAIALSTFGKKAHL